MQDRWVSTMVALRASLLAIPARVQVRSPHLDAKDIAVIDAEIRSTLEALASSQSPATEPVASSPAVNLDAETLEEKRHEHTANRL